MFQELFIALFKAGLPVGLTSFALVWWALRNDYLGAVETLDDVEKEIQRLSKEKDKNKKDKKKKADSKKTGMDDPGIDAKTNPGGVQRGQMSPLHNKWLSFGGGFYGVVALLTYVVIEWGEIRDLFSSLDGISGFLRNINPGMLINFFIESLLNFITAITWPIYWLGNIHGNHFWIWFIVAYGGYWLGSRLAIHQYKNAQSGLL